MKVTGVTMKRVTSIALAGILCGCNVVTVHEKGIDDVNSSKVDGIPFYVKAEFFKKTTVYSKSWYRATLTVETKLVDKKEDKEITLDVNKSPYVADLPKEPNPQLADIKTKIINANLESAGAATEVIAKFRNLPNYDTSTATPELLSNTITSEWVVDRSKTYFLNAHQPWFGSATLTQKLAPDGTLNEGTSTADTKLAEGLSNLIPFKEYLTGKFVETPKEATATAPTEFDKMQLNQAFKSMDNLVQPRSSVAKERDRRIIYAMTLAVEEIGYEYTFTTLPQQAPFTDFSAINFDTTVSGGALFVRKAIPGEKKKEDKAEGTKIGISGTINFPKEWSSTTSVSSK